MRPDDLPAAERVSGATFVDAGRRTRRVSDPEPQPRTAQASKEWTDRIGFFLSVDPAGCWVAVDESDRRDGGPALVGFGIAQNRGPLWYLATYGVLPGYQARGVGSRLMDAVLRHADGRRGLLVSSVHPGATRRFRLAGFTLHPLMRMAGTVDRSTLPAVTGLREGRAEDLEWMDDLDTRLRGAGHGHDHDRLLETCRLVVCNAPGRRGYVFLDDHGGASLLAADDPQIAQRLLWEALASAQDPTLVNCITTVNHWAVDVGLAARLDIGQEGYLAVRAMQPPAPYLASGHFL